MLIYSVLLFQYFCNCEYSERIITHNEKLLKTVKHEQDFNGKKIKTWVFTALESQNHDEFQMCFDPTYHIVYVFSTKMHCNPCHVSVYMIELQNHNFSLLIHGNTSHMGSVKHRICRSGVLLIVYYGEPGIWSRFHDDKKMFYDPVGRVLEVITSDYNPHDFALLTADNTLHYLDKSQEKWVEIRKYCSKPHWLQNGLCFIHTEGGRASLKFWDSKSKTVSDLLQHVVNYGSSENLFWALMKTNSYNKLQFLVDNQYKDAYFGDIYIDDITNVSLHNQMILVMLREEKKRTVSVWISEIYDLKFTKISSLMLDPDTNGFMNSYGYIKIDYNFKWIEKLPGLIFISQVTRKDGKEQKLTMVSYNYGNTFLPIKYKPRQGHCEWVNVTHKLAEMQNFHLFKCCYT
ncbi:hypothetical protein RF11_03815 [Thelohanellus kitauei]|uniref:Uncharacterized protein n=1 Tax=Thelohanellus kitauei TaxID=669202 RepID=A0A0C2N4S1_THEKT|nr:hypothetical protein RF11_03815 [Thelohanellus kitauei]